MEQENSTTLRIGDDFSKACDAFEAYLDGLCIHGECRMPCGIWDSEKKRCVLKHQVRLMHRAPWSNNTLNVPADQEDKKILSILNDICCGIGVEAALNGGGIVHHAMASSSQN